jgi:hypothetical protein
MAAELTPNRDIQSIDRAFLRRLPWGLFVALCILAADCFLSCQYVQHWFIWHVVISFMLWPILLVSLWLVGSEHFFPYLLRHLAFAVLFFLTPCVLQMAEFVVTLEFFPALGAFLFSLPFLIFYLGLSSLVSYIKCDQKRDCEASNKSAKVSERGLAG